MVVLARAQLKRTTARTKARQIAAGQVPLVDAEPPTQACSHRKTILGLALISFAVLLTYGNTLKNGFIQDDKAEILQNPLVRDFSHIPDIFSSAAWTFGSVGPYQLGSSYYRPIQYLSYAALYRLFGAEPWGYHLYKLLSHLAVCCLFFWIVWRSWQDYFVALISSLLFAVHTANTEAVSWISGITDTTCTLLFLVSWLVYLKDRAKPSALKLLLLSAMFLLGLLSKETMAALPAVILVYDWLETGRLPKVKANLRVLGSLLAVFVFYLSLRIHAIGGFTNPRQLRFDFLNPFQIIISQIALLAQYIGLFFFPVKLNAYHVFDPVTSPWSYRFATAVFVLSASLLAGIVVVKQLRPERRRLFLLGLFWFAATILPVIVFFQRLGENVFTERYIYLPSLGLCLSVCLTLDLLGGRRSWKIAKTIFGLLIVTLSWHSIQRNRVWRDDLVFYETTTRASPTAWGLLNNLGAAYNRQGRHHDALRTLEASVAGGPSPTALKNLGYTYAMVGRTKDSERAFRQAIALDHQDSGAYAGLGDVLFKEQRYSEAIGNYEKALALYPNSTVALFAYAEACLADHRYDDSIQALNRILELSPGDSQRAYRQMARVYLAKNLPELAAEAERKASSAVEVQLFR